MLAGYVSFQFWAAQAFLLYALHQPFDATCLPPNMGHPAKASVGLP